MIAKAFLDTNVLVYAAVEAGKDEPKRKRAMELLNRWTSALRHIRPPQPVLSSSRYTEGMNTARYVHWQDRGLWLGYLEEFPDYLTQGETIEELQENLRDLYKDLTSGEIPGIGDITLLYAGETLGTFRVGKCYRRFERPRLTRFERLRPAAGRLCETLIVSAIFIGLRHFAQTLSFPSSVRTVRMSATTTS
jgi:predicted nucleic acid-binding protein